ncbi:MAG: ribosomal protein S18-alanine N-acetyltransferase [Xanthomonadales bacterium]|nr:ribosomal protein S18-alanine N-acetyltransferase [Xanthomonadales bacterium]
MTLDDLDAVMAIENDAQPYPWTRGIFRDCLAVGYRAWLAVSGDTVCGFGLLSCAAGEGHVLNLCVAATQRRQGIARRLLQQLLDDARAGGAEQVFLEVRPSNQAAVQLYESAGFNLVSRRPDYYPARDGGREDALVMAIQLSFGQRNGNWA